MFLQGRFIVFHVFFDRHPCILFHDGLYFPKRKIADFIHRHDAFSEQHSARQFRAAPAALLLRPLRRREISDREQKKDEGTEEAIATEECRFHRHWC